MKIQFFGHATLGIWSKDGSSLIVDPYESGSYDGRIAYTPITEHFNYGVSSHAHDDHNAFHAVACEKVVESGLHGPFEIRRVTLMHDEYDGARFGGGVDALVITCDGLTVVHLSDVGHEPSTDKIQAIGVPDILLVPVGGFYTIGAHQALSWTRRLKARCVIPIHFTTPACTLPIRSVEPFLELIGEYNRVARGFIDVASVNDLPRALILFPTQMP